MRGLLLLALLALLLGCQPRPATPAAAAGGLLDARGWSFDQGDLPLSSGRDPLLPTQVNALRAEQGQDLLLRRRPQLAQVPQRAGSGQGTGRTAWATAASKGLLSY